MKTISLAAVLIVDVAVILIFSSNFASPAPSSSSALRVVVPPVKKYPPRLRLAVVALPRFTAPVLPAAGLPLPESEVPIPARVTLPAPAEALISIVPTA